MVRIQLDRPVISGESLYAILGRCAVTTPPIYLGVVAVLSLGSAYLLRQVTWPLVGLCITTACVSIWGLLEQLLPPPRFRAIAMVEWSLVIIGTLVAVASSLGILFWFLGPAPVL